MHIVSGVFVFLIPLCIINISHFKIKKNTKKVLFWYWKGTKKVLFYTYLPQHGQIGWICPSSINASVIFLNPNWCSLAITLKPGFSESVAVVDLGNKYLEEIGDSLVVVGDEQYIKIHVHTNNPGLVFEKALEIIKNKLKK